MYLAWIALSVGVLAILVVAYLAWSIDKESAGTPQISKIIGYPEEGANAFIKKLFRSILVEHLIEDNCSKAHVFLAGFNSFGRDLIDGCSEPAC